MHVVDRKSGSRTQTCWVSVDLMGLINLEECTLGRASFLMEEKS